MLGCVLSEISLVRSCRQGLCWAVCCLRSASCGRAGRDCVGLCVDLRSASCGRAGRDCVGLCVV